MARKYGRTAVNRDVATATTHVFDWVPVPLSGQLTIQVDFTGMADNTVGAVIDQRVGDRDAELAGSAVTLAPSANTHIFNLAFIQAREIRLRIINPNLVGGTIETIHYLLL